eukprot:527378-Alexandrium_andersonii.AAC.1
MPLPPPASAPGATGLADGRGRCRPEGGGADGAARSAAGPAHTATGLAEADGGVGSANGPDVPLEDQI